MVTAVIERYTQIDDGIPDQPSAFHCIADTSFNGRDEFVRHNAALDVIHEFEARTERQRFSSNPHVSKLAMASSLLLVPPLGFDFLGKRFPVRNMRQARS